MASPVPRPKLRASYYKSSVLRGAPNRPKYDVPSQKEFRCLLNEAMDQQRNKYLKKMDMQMPEFRSAREYKKLTMRSSPDPNKFPFPGLTSTSAMRHEMRDSANDFAKLELDHDRKLEKSKKISKASTRYRRFSDGHHGSHRDSDGKQATQTAKDLPVPTGTLDTHTTKNTGFEPRDVTPDKRSRSANFTKRDEHCLEGSADQTHSNSPTFPRGRPRGRRVVDNNAKRESRHKPNLKFFSSTSLPFLIVHDPNMDGNVLDGINDFLIMSQCSKAEQKRENPELKRSKERREVGLQKLRKAFTEREGSKALAICNDSFHGDPGTSRRGNSKEPREGRNQISPIRQQRKHDIRQSQQNRTDSTGSMHTNKRQATKASSDNMTKKQFERVDLKNLSNALNENRSEVAGKKNIVTDAQKTKDDGFNPTKTIGLLPEQRKQTGINAGKSREKVLRKDINDTQDTDPCFAKQVCMEEDLKSIANHSHRGYRNLQALRGRERDRYGIFKYDRPSSTEPTQRTLSQNSLGTNVMRRAQSLGNQENKLLSPSIKLKRHRPQPSCFRMQKTQKVRFDHGGSDAQILEYSEKDILAFLRNLTQGAEKKKRRLDLYPDPTNVIQNVGKFYKQSDDIPSYPTISHKVSSLSREKGKSSPSSKYSKQNVKPENHIKLSVKGSCNISSPRSHVSASPSETLKLCHTLLSPQSNATSDKSFTSQSKRKRKTELSKSSLDFIHSSISPSQRLDKPKQSKGVLYKSRSPLIDAPISSGADNLYHHKNKYPASPMLINGNKVHNKDNRDNELCQNSPFKAKSIKTTFGSLEKQHDNKGCHIKTQSTKTGENAREKSSSPSKGTDQVRKKLLKKRHAKHVKTAVIKPPTLSTEYRARKRIKLKEKEKNPKKFAEKSPTPRDKKTGSKSQKENLLLLLDEKELCGWESNKPETLCFLQTSDKADFHVPGSDERCSFSPLVLADYSPVKPRLQQNSQQEPPKLKEKTSPQKLKIQSGKELKLNRERSNTFKSTKKKQRTNSDNLPQSSEAFHLLIENISSQYQQNQKKSTKNHREKFIREEESESNTKDTIQEKANYHFKEEDVKQVIASVLKSCHCMAPRILEIREKIETLKTCVVEPRRNKVRHCPPKCNPPNDSKNWTPTVFDYIKLLAFMGLQLLAQFVFVKKV